MEERPSKIIHSELENTKHKIDTLTQNRHEIRKEQLNRRRLQDKLPKSRDVHGSLDQLKIRDYSRIKLFGENDPYHGNSEKNYFLLVAYIKFFRSTILVWPQNDAKSPP